MIHLSFLSTQYKIALESLGDSCESDSSIIRDFEDSVEVHEINKLLWGMNQYFNEKTFTLSFSVYYKRIILQFYTFTFLFFFLLQRRIKLRFWLNFSNSTNAMT